MHGTNNTKCNIVYIKISNNQKIYQMCYPSKSRHTYTCDINKVLSCIASPGCNEISQKVLILLLLVNVLQIIKIMSFSIEHTEADENLYTIHPNRTTKTLQTITSESTN